MPNKLHTDGRTTKYDYIGFYEGLKDSGDLITTPKTITATAEAAAADYSYSNTLVSTVNVSGVVTQLSDALFTVLRMAARVAVTIDSDDGIHDLRCRVYVDSQVANNLLFDLSFTTTGAQASAVNLHALSKPTIFNLLKDGAGHTFYFFFWSPANQNPVISLAQVQYGIGTAGSTSYAAMRIALKGMGSLRLRLDATGIGSTNYVRWQTPYSPAGYYDLSGTSGSTTSIYSYLTVSLIPYIGDGVLALAAQTATDIFVIAVITINLIREE